MFNFSLFTSFLFVKVYNPFRYYREETPFPFIDGGLASSIFLWLYETIESQDSSWTMHQKNSG